MLQTNGRMLAVGDSVSVSGVLTGGEGIYWNVCNRFCDVVVVVVFEAGALGSRKSP